MTAPDLSWDDLAYLVDHHDLPPTGPLPPSTFDIVSVEANVEMTFSEAPLLPTGGVRVAGGAAATLVPAPAGCVAPGAGSLTGTAGVRLVYTRPASVAIHAAGGSVVTVHLYASLSSRIYSPPHQAPVPPSGTLYLVLSAVDAVPQVDLPRGATLCGVTP